MVLKSVDPMSLGKVMGVLYALIGGILGVLFSLLWLLGAGIAASDSGGAGAAIMGLAFGIGGIIFFPIFYGLIGLICGLLMGLLYNLTARVAGGLELHLE